MSNESNNSPPQYIITTPSEVDPEEERSLTDMDIGGDGTGSVVVETSTQQQQRRVFSQMSRQIASRSFSIASASNSILEEGSLMDADLQKQLQQMQSQQQSAFTTQKTISTSSRSQSLQSSSVTGTTGDLAVHFFNMAGGNNNLTSAQLSQQLKALSSTSIVTSEQRMGYVQKTSSTSSTTSTKSKFQSFLQQPEAAVAGSHPASGSGNFLTAHQKHVRQFVRSTSAHSEAAIASGIRPDKCIRSASTQIDEPSSLSVDGGNGDHLTVSSNKLGLHQSSSILISKSADTIEMKSSSQMSSAGMRTGLTLSGGLLAPPNRKITILSPIHAPPGLHDMLKRVGRSPLSPRISFPGSEADLFGTPPFKVASSKIKTLEAEALQAASLTTSTNAAHEYQQQQQLQQQHSQKPALKFYTILNSPSCQQASTTTTTTTSSQSQTQPTETTVTKRIALSSSTSTTATNSSNSNSSLASIKNKSSKQTNLPTLQVQLQQQPQPQQQHQYHLPPPSSSLRKHQQLTSKLFACSTATQKFKSKQLLKATTKVKKKTKHLTFGNTTTPILIKHNTTIPPPVACSRQDNYLRKLSLPTNLPQPLQNSPLSTINSPQKSEPSLAFTCKSNAITHQKSKKSKTTRRLTKFLKVASSASTNSPHSKARRKSSAASIVETALAAAGVTVNLTNASASSASATELLAQDLYSKTPTPASNCDLSVNNCGEFEAAAVGGGAAATAGTSGGDDTSWCGGGVNFLVYMVCSFCCCCYNFRNSPTR